MALYSARTIPKGYRIVKFDEDYQPVAVYDVYGNNCPCFQGAKGRQCRHTRDIIPEFERLGRVDSGQFYDLENDDWHEAISND